MIRFRFNGSALSRLSHFWLPEAAPTLALSFRIARGVMKRAFYAARLTVLN